MPDSFIQELKSRCSLEQIASRYVSFKRAGSNLVACCPFHSERSPSFTLFSPGDHYYCFGCGAGGDVISFVMRIENLDYMAALEYLANLAGMRMPENEAMAQERTDKNKYYDMNKKAARFFYEKLVSPSGKAGLDYLRGRGLSDEIIRRFGLGFASTSSDELTGYLMREGFTPKEMKNGFLCGISENTKRPYDYFRGRVMFPIIDISGKVCAFGGRIIGDGVPKYLNSSDTPVFKKSRTLFALNFARSSGKDFLILCEGYMDVIALHAAGFTNAVATLGTALTSEQARLMRKYTSNVLICYDSDEAGKNAAKRAINILKEVDLSVKVISLKGAKDPDEYIKLNGKSSFESVIANASGHIEYVFNDMASKYNFEAPEDKLSFAKEVCAMLSGVESRLERDVYLGKVNELTGIDAGVLRQELERAGAQSIRNAKLKQTENDIRTALGYSDKVNPEKIKYPSACAKEEGIIGILLIHPEYMLDDKLRECVDPESFVCAFNKKAVTAVTEAMKRYSEDHSGAVPGSEKFDFSRLAGELSPDETGALMRMRIARERLSDNSPEVLKELTEALAAEKRKLSVSAVTTPEQAAERIKRLRDLKNSGENQN
ncbi:MAG: DNA primase [Ruminococcaceae bacterium]|nr:DNA primase [Oscillospiraceae bacterium]